MYRCLQQLLHNGQVEYWYNYYYFDQLLQLPDILLQLVVLLPVAWFMGRFVSLNAVWLAFPIAECVALVIALTMFRKIYNTQIKNM